MISDGLPGPVTVVRISQYSPLSEATRDLLIALMEMIWRASYEENGNENK